MNIQHTTVDEILDTLIKNDVLPKWPTKNTPIDELPKLPAGATWKTIKYSNELRISYICSAPDAYPAQYTVDKCDLTREMPSRLLHKYIREDIMWKINADDHVDIKFHSDKSRTHHSHVITVDIIKPVKDQGEDDEQK